MHLFTLIEHRTLCILEKQTHNLVPPLLFFPLISLLLPRCNIKCYSTTNMPHWCHHFSSLGKISPRQDSEEKYWHWHHQTYFRKFFPSLQGTCLCILKELPIFAKFPDPFQLNLLSAKAQSHLFISLCQFKGRYYFASIPDILSHLSNCAISGFVPWKARLAT